MRYGRGAHESVSVSVQNVRWIDKRMRLLSASASECYVLLCVLSLGVQVLLFPLCLKSKRPWDCPKPSKSRCACAASSKVQVINHCRDKAPVRLRGMHVRVQ